jgi:transglutaminase-like putative cysteine protease
VSTATRTRPAATTAPRTLRAPARRPRPGFRAVDWRAALLALGTLLAAYGGMHTVLQDISWWLVGAAFATGVFLAAALARAWTRSRWVPPLAAIGVSILGVTAGFGGDKAFLGLLPTFESGDAINAVVAQGWESIQEQRVPARPDLGIVLLLALLMIGCALFADAAVAIVRAPALVAAPVLTLLAVPIMVRPGLGDPLWYLLTAGLFLGVLRVGRRPASGSVVALAGAIVLGGSLLAPTFLPEVQEDPGSLTGGVATGINPLINLGDDLRRGDPVLAVTYQTTADAPVYLRLATLEQFNGRSWAPNTVDGETDNTVDDFPTPEGLTSAVKRLDETVTIQVGDIAGRWLPLPYPAESVDGLDGDWFWEATGLTARSTNAGVSGQDYSVDYLQVEPTLEQVMKSTPHADADLPTLSLPARIPDIVTQTAMKIGGDLPTSYQRAMALQDYFTSGDFAYSQDAPVEKGYDGSGVEIMARFLQEKSGYCVHYASTMAVMARILGIPSRVAVGFQPGEAVSQQGITSFQVSSHDLHAWPELYFDGVGWLRFEPTPGRGELPDYSQTGTVDDPTTPQDEGATPEPTASAGATNGPERPDQGDVDTAGGGSAQQSASPLPVVLLVILLVVILGGLAPAVTRIVVRRRRERAIRAGRDPAAAAWAELRDTARDYGWAAPDSETPRDFADRLAIVMSTERERIDGFRSDVEASAFAPPGRGAPTVRELRAMRRAISRAAAPRDRWRAVFLPGSLVTRFRWDPEA